MSAIELEGRRKEGWKKEKGVKREKRESSDGRTPTGSLMRWLRGHFM